ncbi:UNVERIFIED_CONTAM: hypothetical protein GTU68_036410 [Idotea baltica]|nr:hypothetical protein [Idotea baltica]
MSIIKSVLQSSDRSYFTLFYMNKGSQDIIFREDVEHLKNIYLDRFTVHHIFTREQVDNDNFFGRIDEDKIRLYARHLFSPESIKQFFICGPEAMIHSVDKGLQAIGVEANSIKFELFSSPDDHKKDHIAEDEQEAGDSAVRVWVDGEATDFTLSFQGETVLDAALAQGADLPYSCKGGVCSTCKAKILKGSARMEINYALEEDEVEAGYILTCQSHPTSSTLEVELEV